MHKRFAKADDPMNERSKYPKTDLRYWRETVYKPTYARAGKKIEAPNWAVIIQFRGRRTCLSMETANKEAAAARAKDFYLSLQANGWDAALEKIRPNHAGPAKSNVTVGDFIVAVKKWSDLSDTTVDGYARAFRRIVADVEGVPGDAKKFDAHAGGNAKWLAKVNEVPLRKITPNRIQEWKKGFLAKAKRDPISLRRAQVTVNSFLRQARSLFSPKMVLPHLKEITLPSPLPFSGINFEKEPSLEYKSTLDAKNLIKLAHEELAEREQELFKIFLLAVMCGLRKKEIDLLEWSAFRWNEESITIQPTEFFAAKSESSYGEIGVDSELVEIFRGFRARAKGPFVIESDGIPKAEATYQHYRCAKLFDRLTTWLRSKGVNGNKPLHTLRKEFGSEINAVHGIHAASGALRHADIRVTSRYYVDRRARITVGMGHLLRAAEDTTTVISPRSFESLDQSRAETK
jgi:integrase